MRFLNGIYASIFIFALLVLVNGCAIGAKNRVMHQRVKPSEKLAKEMGREGRRNVRYYRKQLKRNKKAIGGKGW